MRKGAEITQENSTATSMKLSAEADVPDAAALNSLIDPEDGVMKSGALPEIAAASSAGAKQLYEAFDQIAVAPKKKARKEEGEAKPAEPMTVLESLFSSLEAFCLNQVCMLFCFWVSSSNFV